MATQRQEIERLKDENLELKLDTIRHQLELVLTQTTKTNGHVADAFDRISTLERQDTLKKLTELKQQYEKHVELESPLLAIIKYKWVRILAISFAVVLYLQVGVGISLLELVKLILS